ncbi:hypothetical protein [Vibrio hippocampi]|uniref:hypothetical protein n=1 Tax=Vibrio hippocampi TaxID=654686 RepID=UPI001F1C0E13|nr:hypothetical protein [Vibrio hippocampi]
MTSKKNTSNPIPSRGSENSVTQLEKEVRELKKRLEMTEMENEFLKKEKAYFGSLKE